MDLPHTNLTFITTTLHPSQKLIIIIKLLSNIEFRSSNKTLCDATKNSVKNCNHCYHLFAYDLTLEQSRNLTLLKEMLWVPGREEEEGTKKEPFGINSAVSS